MGGIIRRIEPRGGRIGGIAFPASDVGVRSRSSTASNRGSSSAARS